MRFQLPRLRLPKILGASSPLVSPVTVAAPLPAPARAPAPAKTTSKEAKPSVAVPLGLYQWTYRADADYGKGDLVTYGGQVWIATQDIYRRSALPGQSGAWRLIVRRGRDGADGQDLALVDAEAVFERDPVTHLTKKMKLLDKETRVLIATIEPKRDSEGFMTSASIKVA
jgi:hypothetical protein